MLPRDLTRIARLAPQIEQCFVTRRKKKSEKLRQKALLVPGCQENINCSIGSIGRRSFAR